jgi:uncharacterized protein (DUF1778 family)
MDANYSTFKLEARISGELHKLLERAAELQGRSMLDFIVDAVRQAAEKTIEQTEIIHLSPADQKCIAEAIISPAPISPALERAFQRHSELVQSD